MAMRILKRWKRLKPSHSGALRYAACIGDVDALDLIASQCNFTADDDHDGFTALHAAAVSGQAEVVEWLILNGANILATSNDGLGDTPLHYAAAKGHLAVVRTLLRYGADAHNRNSLGQSPGHLAHQQCFPSPSSVPLRAHNHTANPRA
eukprot:jgi/Botrbrau1/1542/Bobra.0107s0030.1